MALASFGITQPIPFARHVLRLVAVCCQKVAHDNDQSLFAKAALVFADDAWDYVSDRLSLRIREFNRESKHNNRAAKARPQSKRIRAREKEEEDQYYNEQKLPAFEPTRPANSSGLGTTQ